MINIRPFQGSTQRRERIPHQDKKKGEHKRKMLELKADFIKTFIAKD